MACRAIIPFVEGDELDDLPFDLGFDLTLFPVVRLLVALENGKSLVIDAVIDDVLAGKGHFEFGPTDLIRGQHKAEIEIRDAANKPKTFPTEAENIIILKVRADFG